MAKTKQTDWLEELRKGVKAHDEQTRGAFGPAWGLFPKIGEAAKFVVAGDDSGGGGEQPAAPKVDPLAQTLTTMEKSGLYDPSALKRAQFFLQNPNMAKQIGDLKKKTGIDLSGAFAPEQKPAVDPLAMQALYQKMMEPFIQNTQQAASKITGPAGDALRNEANVMGAFSQSAPMLTNLLTALRRGQGSVPTSSGIGIPIA